MCVLQAGGTIKQITVLRDILTFLLTCGQFCNMLSFSYLLQRETTSPAPMIFKGILPLFPQRQL